MKDTFLTQLNELSMACGVSLAKIEAQAGQWAREFGADTDEVIRDAFAFLRQPGGFDDRWPTYPELKRAFARARDKARSVADVERRREQAAVRPQAGRFKACCEYAVLAGKAGLAQEEIEAGVAAIIDRKTTDAEVRRFLADTRAKIPAPSPRPVEVEP